MSPTASESFPSSFMHNLPNDECASPIARAHSISGHQLDNKKNYSIPHDLYASNTTRILHMSLIAFNTWLPMRHLFVM